MQEEEEKFSDDPAENMKIENEFLKIKLKAQYGDGFYMREGDGTLPTEMENQFLKQIMQFEENYEKAEFITVYEKIGKPIVKEINILNPKQIATAIANYIVILEEHGIMLDINHGPYPDEVMYKFITEELFAQEVEKEHIIAGGNWHFSYEEFHPNDKVEIENNTTEFMEHWFEQDFKSYSPELGNSFVTADGRELNRDDLFKKMSMFFDSFVCFKNNTYQIDEVKFELYDNDNGMGHAEGILNYDAEMETGDVINYKGAFKLYMQREGKYWSIVYFVMPGFGW